MAEPNAESNSDAPEEGADFLRDCYRKLIREGTHAELRTLWQEAKRGLKSNARAAVIAAIIGAGLGWVFNIWIMGSKYDGFNVPSGGIASGKGNVFWGSAFWFVTVGIITTIVGFRLRLGHDQFMKHMQETPTRIRSIVHNDAGRAGVDALWGFAGSLLIAVLFAPAFSGMVALGLFIVIATALRRVLAGIVMVGWQWAIAKVAPRTAQPRPATFEIAVLGMVVGLAAAYLIPGTLPRVLVAVAAGVIAVIIRRRDSTATAAAMLVVIVLISVAAFAIMSSPALADDGGFKECGNPGPWTWLTSCGGSSKLLFWALNGGLASGLGGLLGIPFGIGLGGLIDDFGFGSDGQGPGGEDDDGPGAVGGCDGATPLTPPVNDWKDFRRLHPDAPVDDAWFTTLLARQIAADYASGGARDRLDSMARHMPDAVTKTLLNATLPIGKSMLSTQQYLNSRQSQTDWDNFWNRPSSEINRDVFNALDSFRTGTDPVSRGVKGTIDGAIADYETFKAKYMDAVARGDNKALGQLHADASSEVGFLVLTTVGPEVALRGGIGIEGTLARGAARGAELNPARAASIPIRTRAEIEAAMEGSMRSAKSGETITIKITPDEGEMFNVSKETSLNMWETNLQNGTYQQMKIGPEYGPTVRRGAGDAAYKPNSMGAKTITPEELELRGLDPSRRGQAYNYTPETLPDPSSPAYNKMKFRQDNAASLQAEVEKLSTEGGYGIDPNGNKYHYKIAQEPDGRLVQVEVNGQPIEPRPVIIDEDTFNWGGGQRTFTNSDGTTFTVQIPDDVQQRWIYQQSNGAIAGEGRTPSWYIDPSDAKYADHPELYDLDLAKKQGVIDGVEAEGVITVDADGLKYCKKKVAK